MTDVAYTIIRSTTSMLREGIMLRICLSLLAGLAFTGGAYAASCSNGTIAGDYTFEVHGTTLSSDGSSIIGYIDGVGVITFDGNGNLYQEDYVVRNGSLSPGGPPNPSGFHTEETGTYSINEDCTGSANITLAPGGNTRSEVLVATQTGEIHGQVTAAEVNGSPAVLQVYSSFQRITRR